MIIGVPKEIKNNENRVAMTPASVLSYINAGHAVLVEKNAGLGSNFHDDDYIQAGAKIVATAQEAWDAEMVVKVKEPIASEYQYFREGLLLSHIYI
ncbi:Alanine dehydrogenase 2 [Listeria fleischmannii subsp. fleischmannii]|uniref:Alanine dehydrogenase 2 n=1 Tax=Listeria fleischmannii subsp. fleischmannii TaxID=1671902 RepID=A0A2X3JEA5_9LIST|nr:Alanine dehydrogenase 2 [Listeria fleischmannii subsp. fleischmannii]